jgi:hypothetical protein
MTQFKAIYKGSSRTADNRYYLQIWEYRGHEYEVEVPSNGWMCSSDYQRGGYYSQYNQHRRAQEQIDELIDHPAPEIKEPVKQTYEGSWQEGFDLFWKSINE